METDEQMKKECFATLFASIILMSAQVYVSIKPTMLV